MDNCKKFIADYPVNSAEFFTAITYAATELYISMHVLDLENQKCNWPHERTGEETTVFGFTNKNSEITEINDKIYKDSLTQVMNRKFFDDKLASQNCQAVVMADIDFFKDVNDNYGHQCGDAALAAVASILSTSVRNLDRVVRYGGDEFLITFKGISHEVLRTRLEQMRAKAEKIKLQDYPDVKLTMSFGGTFGDGTVSDMLSFADKALYMSKKKRDCVSLVPFEQ